jgi:ferrous iron transport protein B
MMVAPFMCCGAKLPAFVLLTAAFFADHRGAMLWFIVAFAWVMALVASTLLRRTVIRGGQAPLMLELPPYHLPTPRSVLRSAWQRSWLYMKKAGTVILAINVVLWAIMYFPRADTAPFDAQRQAVLTEMDGDAQAEALAAIAQAEAGVQLRGSIAGRLGRALEPVSQFAGFSWRENIALVGGFAAKEVIVSSLSTAYSLGATDTETEAAGQRTHPLVQRLQSDPLWNPLRAFTLMIFILIYAPCLPTVVVIWRESGSPTWALFATAYRTGLAFVVALFVYQVGMVLGLG